MSFKFERDECVNEDYPLRRVCGTAFCFCDGNSRDKCQSWGPCISFNIDKGKAKVPFKYSKFADDKGYIREDCSECRDRDP